MESYSWKIKSAIVDFMQAPFLFWFWKCLLINSGMTFSTQKKKKFKKNFRNDLEWEWKE